MELKDSEFNKKYLLSNLEQELVLNQQKVSSLERCLDETKQNLNQIYSFNSDLLGQQMERFNQERAGLLDKFETMQNEIRDREREVINAEGQKERLQLNLAAAQRDLAQAKQRAREVEERLALVEEEHDSAEQNSRSQTSELEKQMHVLQEKFLMMEGYCEEIRQEA